MAFATMESVCVLLVGMVLDVPRQCSLLLVPMTARTTEFVELSACANVMQDSQELTAAHPHSFLLVPTTVRVEVFATKDTALAPQHFRDTTVRTSHPA